MNGDFLSIERISSLLEAYPWLEPFLTIEWYGNKLGHYVVALALVLAVYVLSKGITFLVRHFVQRAAKRTETQLDDTALKIMHRSITFILVLFTIYFSVKSLNVPDFIDKFTVKATFFLFTIKIAWELDQFLQFLVVGYLEPLARRQKGFLTTFVSPFSKLIKFIIWALALLLILSNLGYNITSLIAGLGIGGLAVALAAQDTLGNMFGSLSILVDEPFRVGDYIQVGGNEGTVVEVGIRSTKIRKTDRSVVSVPNQSIASSTVINNSRRKMRMVKETLRIQNQTKSELLGKTMKAVEQTLRKHKLVETESARVHFSDFGKNAIELDVFYYVLSPEHDEMVNVKNELNLKMKQKLEKLGVQLAETVF